MEGKGRDEKVNMSGVEYDDPEMEDEDEQQDEEQE